MRSWQSAPFLKVLFPFALGIALYPCLPAFEWGRPPLYYAPLFIIWSILGREIKFRFRILPGLFLTIVFFHCGLFIRYTSDIRNDPRWTGHNPKSAAFLARLLELRPARTGKQICTADILYRFDGGKWLVASGKIQVYFQDGDTYLRDETIVWLDASPEFIAPDPAGATFPLQAYLAGRHIYQVMKVSGGHFEIISRPEHLKTGGIAPLREKILSSIDKYIPGQEEKGLSKALLLGYRGGLDKEIIQAYSGTGVIHVIAVSGLHLGLIYAVLTLIFKPLAPLRWMRFVSSFAILALLWLFTMLCGASPSVLRSALMFSCLVVGELFQKENYSWNAMASSAFILLCIDPDMLKDIGFQLSYGAVASIMLYNKRISSCYHPGNRLLEMAWTAVATTVSAQVLTTPLILYHFHQFPLLFILSNLVAVPLSSIILFLLLIFCLLSFIPFLASQSGILISFLCHFLNNQILRLNSVPFGVIRDIHTDGIDLFLAYACIATITVWLKSKKKNFAWLVLGFLLVGAVKARCCG